MKWKRCLKKGETTLSEANKIYHFKIPKNGTDRNLIENINLKVVTALLLKTPCPNKLYTLDKTDSFQTTRFLRMCRCILNLMFPILMEGTLKPIEIQLISPMRNRSGIQSKPLLLRKKFFMLLNRLMILNTISIPIKKSFLLD